MAKGTLRAEGLKKMTSPRGAPSSKKALGSRLEYLVLERGRRAVERPRPALRLRLGLGFA